MPRIRSSNVELGAHYGVMSIEDFGSHPAYGLDLAYHMTEDLFVRAEVGRSTGGLTSFETLGGNIRLLTEGERKFTYYDLGLGYNFLPGEAFFGRSRAMTSSFYVIGGAGATQFAGDKKFTVTVGAGYQVLPLDWLAVRMGFEDHMFQSDLLGSQQADAQSRGGSRHHGLLLRLGGHDMRNRIAALAAILALALPAWAAAGRRAGARFHVCSPSTARR